MNIIKLTKSKLFYNKWVYKVSCQVYEAYKLRWKSQPWSSNHSADAKNFSKILEPLSDPEKLTVRYSYNTVDIYLNDKDLLDRICKDLEFWISDVYVPYDENEKNYILKNGNIRTVCKNYPYKSYRYKINLQHHIDPTIKENFVKWIKNYDNTQYRMSRQTTQWFNGTKYWIYQPSIYVSDDKILMMINLYMGKNIKSIEEFVLRDSINSSSEI
jgi:hypothetical protein